MSYQLPYEEHCDRAEVAFEWPICLRWWVIVNRLSASAQIIARQVGADPECYAKYKGRWYRLTMASRFGDVGINSNLNAKLGYEHRVRIKDLSDFTDKRPG